MELNRDGLARAPDPKPHRAVWRDGRSARTALWLVALVVAAATDDRSLSPTLLQAFVMPQLSVECLGAIGGAITTCTSPGADGAMSCGLALVRVLQTCPW